MFAGRKTWFAKWFGGDASVEEEDEPARFSPPTLIRAAVPPAKPAPITKPAPKKGFDPYNSGAFERRGAWERINRR